MKSVSLTEQLRRERYIKLGAFLSVLVLAGAIIFVINHILISFLFAFVLNYLLSPFVDVLERKSWSRFAATSLIFLVLGIIISGLSTAFMPLLSDQIEAIRANMPTYIDGTTRIMNETERKLEFLTGIGLAFDLSDQVTTMMKASINSVWNDLPALISGSVTTTLLAPFFAFFMLKDGREIVRRVINLVPNSVFELTLNLQHQINQQIGSFIRARLLEAVIIGFVTWVGLYFISAPYALLLSIFAAITNLIPYVGPFIGAAPAFVIYIINGATYVDIVLVTIVYATAQILDVVVLIPMMVAKLVDLHPVIVVLSLIIGAQLLGILGMLIAIPLTSAIKVTVVTLYDHLLDFRT